MAKVFIIVAGNTWNCHKTFVESLAGKLSLTEDQRPEECDVILVFCPVSSRPGPDIDAALKDIPANKPAVLVVMHHICDPNRSVFDSSNYVTQSNVLSVDCLFYEGKGLFRCQANEEAVEKTIRHIRKHSKETPLQQLSKLEPQPAEELTKPGPVEETTLQPLQDHLSAQAQGPERETSSKSLWKKIYNICPAAAKNLQDAGISEAQIPSLTLQELYELVPGIKNFQKRREIMDVIGQHLGTSNEILREKIRNISPTAARNMVAAGVSDAQIFSLSRSELNELLPGLENFQKRREIMHLIRYHFETSTMMDKIRNIPPKAAELLHAAGIHDTQILTLTQPELSELLPGMENFQMRREIMDLIGQHLGGRIHCRQLQERQLQTALETNMLLIQLLDKLSTREELPKEQLCEGKKSQESVATGEEATGSSPHNENPDLSPLDPDENSHNSRPNCKPVHHRIPLTSPVMQPDKKIRSSSQNYDPNSAGILLTSSPVELDKKVRSSSPIYYPNSAGIPLASPPGQLDKKATNYNPNCNPRPQALQLHPVKVHISGDFPFRRDDFLKKLDMPISECTQAQCRVMLILCPVTSQTGTEIKAALSKIPDNKDAIMVLIHQIFRVPCTLNGERFLKITNEKRNVVETVHYAWNRLIGDIPCDVNNLAMSKIRKVLEIYYSASLSEVD